MGVINWSLSITHFTVMNLKKAANGRQHKSSGLVVVLWNLFYCEKEKDPRI